MPEPSSAAPGPGAYDVDGGFVGKDSPRAKTQGRSILGRFAEYSDMDEIYPKPAPGDYQIPSTFDVGGKKGFSFGLKAREPRPTTLVPGPPEPTAVHREGGMGEAAKNPHWHGGLGFRFNANKRFEDGVKTTEAKEVVHNDEADDPKEAARRQRWEKKKKAIEEERAATYAPKIDFTRPAVARSITMGAKPKVFEHPELIPPAPGAYETYKYEPPGRAANFARGSFRPPLRESGPGPGAYNDHDVFIKAHTARAFTLGDKGVPAL